MLLGFLPARDFPRLALQFSEIVVQLFFSAGLTNPRAGRGDPFNGNPKRDNK
jgi:hypothetical protein